MLLSNWLDYLNQIFSFEKKIDEKMGPKLINNRYVEIPYNNLRLKRERSKMCNISIKTF